jgi:PAS domain S-box-containing protein
MNDAGAALNGFVVAVINPGLSLYQNVSQHWLTTATDEALLVMGDENSTVYISPLKDDYRLFHQVSADNDRIAANFARTKTGAFGIRRDYRGNQVLVTGRRIDRSGWTVVQKIDASEALRESRAHQGFVLTVFLLAVFIITLSFIAIWRHSSSVRLQHATERLAARTALLNSVGDNIREHIFLLKADESILYINRSLANSVGASCEDIIGRSLHHIFSIETTEQLLQIKHEADGGDVRNRVMQLNIADNEAYYHVSMLTLQHGEYLNAVLYVLHDISGLKQAQEKHNRLLEGIIATLVHAVDMHDPHCAHHSERTREVAVAIARVMDLDENRVQALSMAALLANIGKLYLSRSILTKMEPLTAEEEALLRSNVDHAVEILRDLEFDGPVTDIISQKNEYLDGSGYPKGLRGDAILTESRILAVANAFVAMASARAYRPGLPVHVVLDKLLADADKHYDRNVIAALFHVAENRLDWKSWQTVDQA